MARMFQDGGHRRVDLAVAGRRHAGRISWVKRCGCEVDRRLVDLIQWRHLEIFIERPYESCFPARPQIAYCRAGEGRACLWRKGTTFDVPPELSERLFGEAFFSSSRRAI